MQYYIFTNIVLVSFFIAYIVLLNYWIREGLSFKELTVVFLYSIILSCIFKFSGSFHFFGLEYEDAYIFNFSARQLAENIYPVSFLTDAINIGSISHPFSTVTYGGHFITYPVFVNWAYRILGYDMYIPSYLNTLINFLILFTLSLSFKSVFGFAKKLWFIPGAIYSIAPVMNVFGNTHLSETFSSLIVLITILSFYYYFITNKKVILIIFGICFLTALLTKRENTVLLSFFLLFSTYQILAMKKGWLSSLLPVFVSLLVFILYMSLIQNVFLIEKTESTELNTLTFSITYLIKLVPVFVKALVTLKWFSIYFFLLIISIIFLLFKWNKYPIYLSLIALYIIYFLIYTIHYRSYYFVHFDSVKPFEALRYLNNFFVISILIISFCLYEFSKLPYLNRIVLPLLTALILLSVPYTHKLRKEFSAMEKEERFTNPGLVLEYLSKKDDPLLITDNILVFQLLGDRNLEVIDLANIENIPLSFKDRNTYLFVTSFNKTDFFQNRFSNVYNKFQIIEKKEVVKFGNDDSLYKIE